MGQLYGSWVVQFVGLTVVFGGFLIRVTVVQQVWLGFGGVVAVFR